MANKLESITNLYCLKNNFVRKAEIISSELVKKCQFFVINSFKNQLTNYFRLFLFILDYTYTTCIMNRD